jgi:hypothetical protein
VLLIDRLRPESSRLENYASLRSFSASTVTKQRFAAISGEEESDYICNCHGGASFGFAA